jgi:hypothetical protein
MKKGRTSSLSKFVSLISLIVEERYDVPARFLQPEPHGILICPGPLPAIKEINEGKALASLLLSPHEE